MKVHGGAKNKDIFPNDIVFEEKDVIDNVVKSFIGLTGKETKRPEKIDSTISVWAKLYKLNIIKENKIEFMDYKKVPSECQLFNIQYFIKAKKVVYIKKYLYHYRRNTKSSITKRYREDITGKWQYWIKYMKEYIKHNLKNNEEIWTAYYNRICFTVIPLSGNSLKQQKYTETYKDMKNILNDESYKEAYKKLDFTYFPIHWKIYFFLAKKRWIILFCILSKIMRIMIEKRKS